MKALLAAILVCGAVVPGMAQLTLSGPPQASGVAATDIDTTTEINALTTNDDFPTLTAANIFNRGTLGTTPDFAFQLANTTAAASGLQQISPSIRWTGQGWKTTATAASQAVDFQAYVVPVQGTTNPTGTWNLAASVNGGAFASVFSISSSNSTNTQSRMQALLGTVLNADGSPAGNPYFHLASTGISLSSGGNFNWSSGASATGTADTGIARNAAGVLEVNTGTDGALRDILTRGLRTSAVAFASAIGSPVEGTIQAFTDSNTSTWGDTITGGGANHVLGYYNGTNWTVIGK